ncbi:MAG: SH3 domain-containing protein [Chloroflexota bacterium]
MNLLNTLATPNPTILLVVGGLALLLVNIVYGVIRVARGNLKVGWFTVGLVLVACTLITVGAVQTATASAALTNRATRPGTFAGGRPTPTVVADTGAAEVATPAADGAAANAPAILVSDAKSTVAPDSAQADSAQADSTEAATPRRRIRPTQAASDSSGAADGSGQSADSSAGASDPSATQAVTGTPGRRTRPTQTTGDSSGAGAVNGQNGSGTNGTNGSNGSNGTTDQSSGNPASNVPAVPGGANNPNANRFAAIQQDQAGLNLAALGGGIIIVLGLVLYFFERRRTGFTLANSRGLLNLAAGFFVVIAALLIPIIPGQPSSAAAAAAAGPRVNRIAAAITATPSPTPRPTNTATPLATLTPMATSTPMAMPTQIQYTSTYTADTAQTVCSATANTVLSLRADPSTKQQAIGRVFAGSLLNVTGSNADKTWWRVMYTDAGVSTQGWVSATFVTLNPTCANQTFPVVS